MDCPHPAIPPGDRRLAFAFLCIALVLRSIYAWHFRIDSDELQHLHVVWAWTQGLLPYRDVFDNHAPVFQAACAPLFHALGVRADIVLPMRLAMFPIFFLTIWCVRACARTMFAPRAALWAAVFAAFCPPFFFTSIEFRPDELWALAWLLTLTILLTGRLSTARLFSAGLMLGFAFSVSMKTSVLLAALAFASAGTLLVRRGAESVGVDWKRVARGACAALLGMLVVPALVVSFFIAHDAGAQMYYCVIQHNVLPGSTSAGRLFRASWHWLLWLLPIIAAGVLIARLPMPIASRRRIAFAFFAAAFYFTSLICFWPILTAEDYLPLFPALMITAGPALLWLADFVGRLVRLPALSVPILLVVTSMAWITHSESPFIDKTADKIGIIADALKLTDADDLVMDSKGETIYRRRPFYYVLEKLTNVRLKSGITKDDIPQRLIDTRTPLATLRRMPTPAKLFLHANYIPIAFRLSVAGKILRDATVGETRECVFDIAVPQRYALACEAGPIAGILDDTPVDGPRELAAGRHEFVQTGGPGGRLAIIWAQAIERGYSPFAKIKHDYTTEQD